MVNQISLQRSLRLITVLPFIEAPPQRPRQGRASPAADEPESSGASSEDDYVQEKRPGKAKKKTRRRGDEDGEKRSTQKKRKRKQPQVEEVDWDALLPEEGMFSIYSAFSLQSHVMLSIAAAKLKLDMQIEAILKPKKASRPKRKKKDADEDVLDRAADEEVSRLREAMLSAAADDEQANRDKMPATSKLKMLPQVMDVLRK